MAARAAGVRVTPAARWVRAKSALFAAELDVARLQTLVNALAGEWSRVARAFEVQPVPPSLASLDGLARRRVELLSAERRLEAARRRQARLAVIVLARWIRVMGPRFEAR